MSSAIGLVAGEAVLGLLGYRSYHRDNRFRGERTEEDAAFCGVDSIEAAVEQGLVEGPLGNLKPDAALGYTLFDDPHGFTDEKDFHADYTRFHRVLVLGDSFTAGGSADERRGYVDLLNQHYREAGTIFFNTGVPGYGQNNQLAVLETYCDVVDPDMVLLGFYTGNDFSDNLTPLDRWTAFPRRYVANYRVVTSRDGVGVRRRTPDEILNTYKRYLGCPTSFSTWVGAGAFLREEIVYGTRVGTRLWLLTRALGERWAARESRGSDGADAERDHAHSVTRRELGRIAGFLRDRNVPLIVLLIPDVRESEDALTRSRNYLRAITLCEDMKLTCVDPHESLSLSDYAENEHWNNAGHEKMFRVIEAGLDGAFRARDE